MFSLSLALIPDLELSHHDTSCMAPPLSHADGLTVCVGWVAVSHEQHELLAAGEQRCVDLFRQQLRHQHSSYVRVSRGVLPDVPGG